MTEGKTIGWMIVFGVVRAFLAWFGGYLSGKGVIDDGVLAKLLSSETAVNVTAFIVSLLPVVWTVLQKYQVGGWLTTAAELLRRSRPESASLMSTHESTPERIIESAPGPNMPI